VGQFWKESQRGGATHEGATHQGKERKMKEDVAAKVVEAFLSHESVAKQLTGPIKDQKVKEFGKRLGLLYRAVAETMGDEKLNVF
jgi:hypothetical protein